MLVKLKKYKKRGSFLLTSILAAIVLSFIAQAIVVTATGGFGMITASRNALQAQQYATIDADALKMVDYSELDTYGPLARTAITNISESGWEHEITIGDETDIAGSDDAKQRIAKINIYKTDDTIPRFSLEVPLASQGSRWRKDIEEDIKKLEDKIGTGTFTQSQLDYLNYHYVHGGVFHNAVMCWVECVDTENSFDIPGITGKYTTNLWGRPIERTFTYPLCRH